MIQCHIDFPFAAVTEQSHRFPALFSFKLWEKRLYVVETDLLSFFIIYLGVVHVELLLYLISSLLCFQAPISTLVILESNVEASCMRMVVVSPSSPRAFRSDRDASLIARKDWLAAWIWGFVIKAREPWGELWRGSPDVQEVVLAVVVTCACPRFKRRISTVIQSSHSSLSHCRAVFQTI